MFRTSYFHHQEDYIVQAALYGIFFMHLCKHTSRLKDVLDARTHTKLIEWNIREYLMWLTSYK
jgi:hypothetical protein